MGCSYGGFLLAARQSGFQGHGIDIVPEAVQYVREQGIPCETAMSVDELSLPDDSQDVVTVLDCNYYWPDQAKELSSIRNKLRPGGLLVIRMATKSWMLRVGLLIALVSWPWPASMRPSGERPSSFNFRPDILVSLACEGFDVLYSSPQGAMQTDKCSPLVKVSFGLGSLIWRLTGQYVAPGCLILCRKRAE